MKAVVVIPPGKCCAQCLCASNGLGGRFKVCSIGTSYGVYHAFGGQTASQHPSGFHYYVFLGMSYLILKNMGSEIVILFAWPMFQMYSKWRALATLSSEAELVWQ